MTIAQVETTPEVVTPKKLADYSNIVMPYKSPFDKIAAFVWLTSINKRPIEGVSVWKWNDCPPENFAVWEADGTFPIDIGKDKYHAEGVNAQSAMEVVVRQFGITDLSPGFANLLRIVNRNNKKGDLKSHAWPVARMLRDFYELTDDPAFHLAVINAAADVILAYVTVENGEATHADEPLSEGLKDLEAQFAACKDQPITLGRYLQDLWKMGFDEESIRARITFWTTHEGTIQANRLAGAAAYKALPDRKAKEFTCVDGQKGIVLRSDDRYLRYAATMDRQYAIRIFVSSDGHVVITSRNTDMSKVAAQLQLLERSNWYYQSSSESILNGGPMYVGTPPTKLYVVRIVAIVRENAAKKEPKKRKDGQGST